jgi:hypothetical protein
VERGHRQHEVGRTLDASQCRHAGVQVHGDRSGHVDQPVDRVDSAAPLGSSAVRVRSQISIRKWECWKNWDWSATSHSTSSDTKSQRNSPITFWANSLVVKGISIRRWTGAGDLFFSYRETDGEVRRLATVVRDWRPFHRTASMWAGGGDGAVHSRDTRPRTTVAGRIIAESTGWPSAVLGGHDCCSGFD